MSFKKNLETSDVSLTSFQVHKKFSFTEVDSGSGVFSVPIIKGSDSNLFNFKTTTADSETISGSTFYKVPDYHMINTLYYKDIRQMRGYIDYVRGVPTQSSGVVEYLSESPLENTSMTLRRPYTRQLHSTATVISLPQKFYGEYIKPYSIEIVDNGGPTTITLRDDGRGNLYDVDYSQSYSERKLTKPKSGSLVGNVFYNDGLVVITHTGSFYSNVGTGTGSDGFSIDFKATQTIYEREYLCRVEPNEFMFTTNKSARVGRSGSYNIGPFVRDDNTDTIDDDYPYEGVGYSTSSYSNEGYNIGTELIGQTTHSEFGTYVTAIGLYNDDNELLAIGKPAAPIKNDKELLLNFIVRFDTN